MRIITDGTADLTPERRGQLGVEVMPLTVVFGGESFVQDVDLSVEQFYTRLERADELPTTSQVSPGEFERVFRAAAEAGEEVVCLTVASSLSGTCQSALLARELVGGEGIHVLDSETVAMGLRLLVEKAVQLRDAGLSAGRIVAEIQVLIPRVRLLAVVGTLKYLRMGGRLSAGSAAVGSVLGICPVITLRDGKVEAIGKPRGRKAAFAFLREQLVKCPPAAGQPVIFGHSNDPALLEAIEGCFLPLLSEAPILDGPIGSVVGTHAGPGAAGFAYLTE